MNQKKHVNSQWSKDPESSEWNNNANWTPTELPTNKATFGESSKTIITFAETYPVEVEVIEFASGASPFMLKFTASPAHPTLTISGEGVINNSAAFQSFFIAALSAGDEIQQLVFRNGATAGGDLVNYYIGPQDLQTSFGGGIMGFYDRSTAGSASFIIKTGAVAPPKGEPVGAQLIFYDNATAASGRFTIYGSLGIDNDTFGSVVFRNNATAARGTFINIGGTIGDGGNTQFYENASAGRAVYNNYGAIADHANGGDVAFDGFADGGTAHYHNHAALAPLGSGGVTSFNNNPPISAFDKNPIIKAGAANAGHGYYSNYGALHEGQGNGGHTEFTAEYGYPTAGHGIFVNYGSAIAAQDSAGRTLFYTSEYSHSPDYYPSAGNGTFYNHAALNDKAAAGYTDFSVYRKVASSGVPTGADGVFHNLGANTSGTAGGYTSFSGTANAERALFLCYGGNNGGLGGGVIFKDTSKGETSTVQLEGNGYLDISSHDGPLSIGNLQLNGGVIKIALGAKTTSLHVGQTVSVLSKHSSFYFSQGDGFCFNEQYPVLIVPEHTKLDPDNFAGNTIDFTQDGTTHHIVPKFSFADNKLYVSYDKDWGSND